MTSKHTPGPWNDNGFNTKSRGRTYARAVWTCDGERFICSCDSRYVDEKHPNLVHNKQEIDANMRLIAAAPDMLHALQSLFKHCSMVHSVWGEGSNKLEADAAIQAGLDAIAKATGDSQ